MTNPGIRSLSSALRPLGVVLAIVLAFSPVLAGIANVPTDSPVYEDIELLKTAGLVRSMPYTSRPWTLAACRALASEADQLSAGRPHGNAERAALARLRAELGIGQDRRKPLLSLAVPVEPDARFDADLFSRARAAHQAGTGSGSGSIGAVLANRPGANFAFYERAEFTMFRPDTIDITDSAGTHVPGSRVHSWMKLATFETELAYLAFRIPWLRLQLGRDEFRWGPGYTGSVMLGDNAPALDNIQLDAAYSGFRYTFFTAAPSRWGEKHRFLSAQRLELSILRRLTLGGAMMNVYSWDSLQTRDIFGMMNPLLPIYLTVANSGHEDNLLVGADAVIYLPRTKLYGQLFIDNYEFVERESKPCDAVAYQLGAQTLPGLGLEARAEYTRVNPFTYYHRLHHIMYENYGVPLGHPLGPDADQVYFRLAQTPADALTLAILGTYTRRGYYNRGDFVRKTWHAGQPLPEKFPAEENGEKVENTILLGLETTWQPLRDLKLTAALGLSRTANVQGTPDSLRTSPDLNLKIQYRY